MSKPKLYHCEFEIRGNVPKEVFESFTTAQAALLGIRGYIDITKDNIIKGVVEGEKHNVQQIKEFIEMSEKFKKLIQKIIFTEMKEIDKYAKDMFEVRK